MSSARVHPVCQAMFARAIEILAGLGYDHQEIRVRVGVESGPEVIRFSGIPGRPTPGRQESAMKEPTRPEGIPPHWRWLSPLGQQIVQALEDAIQTEPDTWLSSDEIARACDLKFSSEFKAILHELVERGIVEAIPGRGHRISR